MLSNFLLVGLGGAIGSMLRFAFQKMLNDSFPVGTLLVNVIGCLLIGLLWGYFAKTNVTLNLLLVTGFCGGFTTFSAFTQEGVDMLLHHRFLPFILYTSLSVVVGLAATFAGYKITS